MFNRRLTVLALISLAATAAGIGQTRPPSADIVSRAQAAEQKRDYTTAADLYQQAVALSPGDAGLHNSFMAAVRSAEYARAGMDKATTTAERRDAIYMATVATTTRLAAIYEAWSRRFGDKPAVWWGLGRQYVETPAKADAAFMKAVALDPAFARAYLELARAAEMRDNRPATRDYYVKAARAEPGNDQYAYLAVNALKALDRTAYIAAVDDLVARFPNSQWSSRALLTVSQMAATPAGRVAALERHLALFPDQAVPSGSANSLYEAYLGTDPAKALELARRSMAEAKLDFQKESWLPRVAFADGMTKARAMLADGRATDARATLDRLTLPARVDDVPWVLLKSSAAERAGEPKAAYESLVQRAADWPDARVAAEALRTGRALGKTAADVEVDTWTARERGAKPLTAFDLERLGATGRVTSADLQGRVVLVNFWFPT